MEYGDYTSNPTKFNASQFLTLAMEENWSKVQELDGYDWAAADCSSPFPCILQLVRRAAGRAIGQASGNPAGYLPAEAAPEAPSDSAGDQEPLVSDERTVIPDYVLSPNMEMPVETINGIDFIGVLRIPALELELPIISEWNYPNLKTAPCRYSGSAYLNNLIICGHNYTSHFGTLKNLWEGDIATFTDMDGNVFTYKMVERETLNPTDIEGMESGNWDLTLFTCTVGGQSRVTIRFELEED